MAPEQERGDVGLMDARTDVFGLGAVLRVVAGDMPRRLRAVADRATAASPEARYPDATALGADLARFLDGEPVSAYPEGPLERLERVAYKYRAALVLVLVYLLLRALFIILARR
jgi:serine/threonine-protein kinase